MRLRILKIVFVLNDFGFSTSGLCETVAGIPPISIFIGDFEFAKSFRMAKIWLIFPIGLLIVRNK